MGIWKRVRENLYEIICKKLLTGVHGYRYYEELHLGVWDRAGRETLLVMKV